MPDSLPKYKVSAVYYIDTSDAVVRSRLIKIRQNDVFVIILHHYNLDEVLHIFKMVLEVIITITVIINICRQLKRS